MLLEMNGRRLVLLARVTVSKQSDEMPFSFYVKGKGVFEPLC